MDLERLAHRAARLISTTDWRLLEDHGLEVARGFFCIYNHVSGQSRSVLYHPASDYVFKNGVWYVTPEESNSNKYIGTVELEGKTYRIRFPRLFFFETPRGTIEVQEYIHGEEDWCMRDSYDYNDCWCEHAQKIHAASGLSDTHTGNWKIVGDEIVIFDC